MVEEKHEEGAAEASKKPEKKVRSKKLLVIILSAVLVLGGAVGFAGYKLLSGKGKTAEGADHKKEDEQKSVLVALDPFVVNLTEHGRYLKVTMQLELSDASQQQQVTDKVPNIRDAIITLLSSKSAEAIAGPEGKLQLKDELLLRATQAVGKDSLKNLYFTEFVMQ
jgi:flagellar FliL protein